MRVLPLLLLLAACAGGGVAAGKPCSSPASSVVLPPSFSGAAPGVVPREPRWWTTFGDTALDGLVDRALRDNLTIAAARERLLRASALARVAAAPLRPSVDASAAATGTTTRREVGGTTVTEDSDDLSVGASASYEVDLWGRNRALRDAARWEARSTAAALDAARISIAASVATTWYRFVEEEAIGRLLDEQIATNAKLLDLVRARFDAGQAGAADVLRQEQLVERTRGDRADSASRRDVLKHQLATLLGRPATEALPPALPEVPALPPLPDAGVPAVVLQRRPDVEGAWFDVLAADRDLAASIADRYPRVVLSAAAVLGGGGFQSVFGDFFGRLAADLAAPLFDGGERKGRIDANRALVRERVHVYGEALLEALREAEDALVRETYQRTVLASLERQHELSRQVVESLVGRYGQGAAPYLDVLAAIQSEQTLARNVVTARRLLLEHRIALCRALAGSWTPTGEPT